MNTAKTMYYLVNGYLENSTSIHTTAEAALRAGDKREGIGWLVYDEDGNRYDWNGETAYISEGA